MKRARARSSSSECDRLLARDDDDGDDGINALRQKVEALDANVSRADANRDERGGARERVRGTYVDVNAMLRELHFERARRREASTVGKDEMKDDAKGKG